ncbi:hypothetical protein [Yersinia massiliensis]|uniref:hypothetical protein n=1 Tax=Yersinia massiliensis TaxID=419257 RepID=UPI001CFC7A93|nr:hypothetical protein [Yersinia massiliensis]MCB5310529.1 hypothetical protein [Yersinia massiliensis]
MNFAFHAIMPASQQFSIFCASSVIIPLLLSGDPKTPKPETGKIIAVLLMQRQADVCERCIMVPPTKSWTGTAMNDNRNDASRNMLAIARRSLSGEEYPEELFHISRDVIDALEGLSPDNWPTTGQAKINWDLTVKGREFTVDLPDPKALQPVDCTDVEIDSLVLGKVLFSDFDPLLHPRFRRANSRLWAELDPFKLGRSILHIAKGWPVSPVWLCMHEYGGFHFGGGTHRYEVLKRTGVPHLYVLAEPGYVPEINTLLKVEWTKS